MESSKRNYQFRITADERVYADLRQNGGGPVKVKLADNCKKCKRHQKNLTKERKRKYDLCKQSLKQQQHQQQQQQQQHYSEMEEDGNLHYMTIPRTGKQEWDPRMTMTSPIEWETSPLVTSAGDTDSVTSTLLPTVKNKSKTPDVVTDNDERIPLTSSIPDVISNNEAGRQGGEYLQQHDNNNEIEIKNSSILSSKHRRPNSAKSQSESTTVENKNTEVSDSHHSPLLRKARAQSEVLTKARSKSRSGSTKNSATGNKSHRSKSLYTPNEKQRHHNQNGGDSEHFIIVNVPENAFTPGHLDAKNHNTILSIADDTATVVSEGVKCRYCLTNDTLNNESLISPCQCCGTSKFVHKSCLEKWLTLRNLDACEVCKAKYRTKWVHRPLCSLNFPSMKKHDVFLLMLTISFYATLIFQFLGAVYVSIMASALPSMVTIVTLIGLSLGIFWFLTGSIALSIVLYTSDYWKAFRKANKKKVIVLDDTPTQSALLSFPSDLSQAVAV